MSPISNNTNKNNNNINHNYKILPYDYGEISIYIHWPFCLKKCPYCDFNSHVSNSIDHKLWYKAYFSAFELQKPFFANKKIKSIFFGGGTPSLMNPQTVSDIIAYFTKHNKAPISEITLESNPSTFEINRFENFKQAGINRLSTGIQSFFDKNLKFLGRNHNRKEAILALEHSNKIFDRTSFDLIIGLPNQTLDEIKQELKLALHYFKEHISLYQLTIEEGTAFYRQKVPEMSDEKSSVLYNYVVETLAKNNICQYEVSNFAIPKKESIHNLNYWKGGEYLGFGPDSQGRIYYNNTWFSSKEIKNPKRWLNTSLSSLIKQDISTKKPCGDNTEIPSNPLQVEMEKLSDNDRYNEIIMTHLRIKEGLPNYLSSLLDNNKIQKLLDEKLLEYKKNTLHTTNKGYICLNYVISTLLV